MKLPVIVKEKELEIDFRCDLFVENCFLVELKSILQLNPIFEAQLQTYMKLLITHKGIIINLIVTLFLNKSKKRMSMNTFKFT